MIQYDSQAVSTSADKIEFEDIFECENPNQLSH